MRIVNFRQSGGQWRAGLELGSAIVEVGESVKSLIAGGASALAAAKSRANMASPVSGQIEIGPPVSDPDKIICIGLNYRKHAEETGQQLPKFPTFFPKYRNSLIANGEPIVLPPKNPASVDYEVELAAVIGKRCKGVSESDALEYVVGYSILNDVSARDLQMQTSQWGAGKAVDTFAPFGPAIVTADEIGDPQKLAVKTRLNGQVMQSSSTADMVFSVAQIIAYLSSFMTLEPGDVIATGTPEGVGFTRKPPVFMKDGDVVEQEIEKIGVLRNPVVARVPAAV
jgi:2-keto-4-pentenoate hydratase/2-oxohepta-3-ene-1,7-dioic acid hydratase in catechol pathway